MFHAWSSFIDRPSNDDERVPFDRIQANIYGTMKEVYRPPGAARASDANSHRGSMAANSALTRRRGARRRGAGQVIGQPSEWHHRLRAT